MNRDNLKSLIIAKAKQLKADDTVAISVDNMSMLVRPPNDAPKGTNGRYYYMQAFREVCAELNKKELKNYFNV